MLIDVNVHLSRWPGRRLPHDEPARFLAKLKASGIEQAWAGSFDAILHKDIAAVNARIADECHRSDGVLVPLGAVNPTLPDWQEDLRRCAKVHMMRGIRLHPDYHGYGLDDPRFNELLDLCTEHRLLVQISVSMEDQRTQHPLLKVPLVDLKPLAQAVARRPQLKVILLNAFRTARVDELARCCESGEVYLDIATLEGIAGLEKTLKQIPQDRILFGSNFPFYYLESALLKLQESEIGEVQRQAISRTNAERLLAETDGKTQ